MRPALCGLDPDVSIDQVLMTGWEAVHKNIMSRELRQEPQHPAQMSSDHAGTDLRNMISDMWTLRAQLRTTAERMGNHGTSAGVEQRTPETMSIAKDSQGG